MTDPKLSRRALIAGSALLPAAAAAAGKSKNIVISSRNGLRASTRAMEMLRAGGDTLDAVVAGVPARERWRE